MKIKFWKYQGNGNDFVIIDNRHGENNLTKEQIEHLCNRRYGIGADGLIVIATAEEGAFEMLYYNSDGALSSMCGNGGRCAAMYAFVMGIADKHMTFKAFDGLHQAVIEGECSRHICDVSLSMSDVMRVEKEDNFYFLDTGSPHYVEFVDRVAEIDVVSEGRKTRYSERFMPGGTNVNFVEMDDDRIFVRTYERGVEDETLSCGTGVTASAMVAYLVNGKRSQMVHTTGGDFVVSFDPATDGSFTNVWLRGPAEAVFEGTIELLSF